MSYILDEKDIEQIIKEGEFNPDKYITKNCILGWTYLDILSSENNDLFLKEPEELKIKNKEKLEDTLDSLYTRIGKGDYSDVYEDLVSCSEVYDIDELIKIKEVN